MRSLAQVLSDAQKRGVAVGHFNVSDLTLLQAAAAAARELKVPVLVGASEGERAFLGTKQLAALVLSVRDQYTCEIFLNADHTHSLAKAEEAVAAGFDSVVFDLSSLPLEVNARMTKQAVDTLKSMNSSVLIEGEIGDIGSGSEIHERAIDLEAGLTNPEEARQFVAHTGVDILAPAVGNMHGMLKSMVGGQTHKRLNIKLIRQIKKKAGIFLTLHGSSGTDDRDLRDAIAAGMNIIHINTELRLAWRRALDESLTRHPEEVVPYKILPPVVEAVKQVVRQRLELFNQPGGVGESELAS
jgi:fructose-bisphosphate aldolase class II